MEKAGENDSTFCGGSSEKKTNKKYRKCLKVKLFFQGKRESCTQPDSFEKQHMSFAYPASTHWLLQVGEVNFAVTPTEYLQSFHKVTPACSSQRVDAENDTQVSQKNLFVFRWNIKDLSFKLAVT